VTAPAAARDGIDRLSLYFATATTRQGVLARRVLGPTTREDAALARRLLEEMRGESRQDGSIAGAVVPTIWRAHEFMDLGYRGDETSCARIMEWILALQQKPGAFNEGCSRTRHAHRVCEHFISGFFSPAPPEQRLAPVTLPNGKMLRSEPAARFAISCMAFRAALRGGYGSRPGMERHLLSLMQMQEQWQNWNGYLAPDAIVAGIHALAFLSEPHRGIIPKLVSIISDQQAEDGTWPNADLFHVLETLLALGTAEARGAVRRAVPALLARQRFDGSFGPTAQQERALIALRVLIWAEQEG
jgi:hypothetical protein